MALDEKEWEQTGPREIGDPDLSSESEESEDEDEDGEQETPIQTPGYPQQQVRRRIKNAIDGYQASQLEVVDHFGAGSEPAPHPEQRIRAARGNTKRTEG